MTRLQAKRVVVTGASSGIGAAIAQRFAEEGASVLAVARDKARLAGLSAGSGEGRIVTLSVDVTETDAGSQIRRAVTDELGGIDVLVQAAGLFEPRPFAETSADSFDRQFAVNVRAPFLITQALASALQESASGTALFLSSVCGHIGFPGSVAYCASKGAVEMLVKALAVDLPGVRVNAITPGWITTPMNDGILADGAYRASQINATPRGRLGKPEDVAKLAVFLASDEADYVHGSSVWIDGGFPAPPRLQEGQEA